MSNAADKRDKIEEVVTDSQANNELVCRGCLKKFGEMKNMYEWGLDVDFFKYTDIPKHRSEDLPELLCTNCEENLQTTKTFRDRCQQSDKTLRSKLKKKKTKTTLKPRTQVTSVLHYQKLVFLITAPNPEDKILLQCPHNPCPAEFYKKTLLLTHLQKNHNASTDFAIEQQFFCSESGCVYNMSSEPAKFFPGRKNLNQHYNKTHKDRTYMCETCNMKFPKVTDYYRHLKVCNLLYVCPSCSITYSTNESFLVHLKRKHPELHAQYKEEKKAQKRLIETNLKETSNVNEDIQSKKMKKDAKCQETAVHESIEPELQNTESNNATRFNPFHLNVNVFESTIPQLEFVAETEIVDEDRSATEDSYDRESTNEETVAENFVIEEIVDEESIENQNGEESLGITVEENITSVSNECPKKSSATQIPEDITNDVSLNSWSNKNDFEIQNEMSTQTVFEDLLSMKSQNSEDEIFFSESVSLSDIQTQTAPFEFGLSRCNKETQSFASQTQSPDLSMKETQTCFCHDSPRLNFRHFDSLTSSPGSSHFISTETQTGDVSNLVRSDVLLSFSSAETQTCFDDSSNSSM